MLDKITKGELPTEKQWADFQQHLPHLRVHELKDLRDKLVANLMRGNKVFVRVGKSKADRMQRIKDAVQRLVAGSVQPRKETTLFDDQIDEEKSTEAEGVADANVGLTYVEEPEIEAEPQPVFSTDGLVTRAGGLKQQRRRHPDRCPIVSTVLDGGGELKRLVGQRLLVHLAFAILLKARWNIRCAACRLTPMQWPMRSKVCPPSSLARRTIRCLSVNDASSSAGGINGTHWPPPSVRSPWVGVVPAPQSCAGAESVSATQRPSHRASDEPE